MADDAHDAPKPNGHDMEPGSWLEEKVRQLAEREEPPKSALQQLAENGSKFKEPSK